MIETRRLTLRRLSPDDSEFILELLNDPSFIRYIGDKQVRTPAQAVHYIIDGPISSYERFGFGLYLVELKATRESLGICGLLKREYLEAPDLGFAFLPRFRRNGYAFEAARAVLRYGRDACRLHRIAAITAADNAASIALLEKLGFSFARLIEAGADDPPVRLFLSDPSSAAAHP